MRYALGSNGVSYSPAERAVFSLLQVGEKNRKSTTLITRERYGHADLVPFHGQSNTVAALRSLARKVEANAESFVVKKTTRAGPHPVEFWLEKRP